MKIPDVTDSRLQRLVDCASRGSVGARQARNDVKAVFGYVVIMAALVVTIPSIGCAQQASSIGGKTGADEALSEQVTDPLSYLTQIQINSAASCGKI